MTSDSLDDERVGPDAWSGPIREPMKPDQNLPGTSLPGVQRVGRRNRPCLSVTLFLLIICATTAIDSAASSAKNLGTVLTGKFIARVEGPSVTGFGMNHNIYIFEMYSPTGSQLVALSDTFLIYQPHLPLGVLDYSKLYKLAAVRDDKCDDTLENISRRSVFDSHGHFVETKNELTYAQNSPPPTLPWRTALPCYVVSPVSPPASVLTESTSPQ